MARLNSYAVTLVIQVKGAADEHSRHFVARTYLSAISDKMEPLSSINGVKVFVSFCLWIRIKGRACDIAFAVDVVLAAVALP